ncbi:hypothetical protein ACFPM0_05040 [Pseudonocardia sulfidoxydans]|uniref:MmyB family transcriptional regulator n=1 Tax=Pseudonocardia sulfidoxydans TaxID=54011 RepID=UPI0036115027
MTTTSKPTTIGPGPQPSRACRWWASTGPTGGEHEPGELLLHRGDGGGDARLATLHQELTAYPGGTDEDPGPGAVVVPLRLRVPGGELALFSPAAHVTTAASDVTVDELAVETFHPADAATADALRRLTT